jgi:TPR repeat protein
MKRLTLAWMIAIACCWMTGCASIVSHSKYKVDIRSEPPGADFEIQTSTHKPVAKGRTPATVTLNASARYFVPETYTVTFTKNGYHEEQKQVVAAMDPWYMGNILFGGLIGILLVDPLTGAMWKLPEEMEVNLKEAHFHPPVLAKPNGEDEAAKKPSLESQSLHARWEEEETEATEARFRQGVEYIRGQEGEQDWRKGALCFQDAAEAGLDKAQYMLGLCYLHGRGVAKNPGKALFWLQKAADLGYEKAQKKLSDLMEMEQ